MSKHGTAVLIICALHAGCSCQPPAPPPEGDEVLIPAGTFIMGHDPLPEDDRCTQLSSQFNPCNAFAPKHSVTLDAYYIDRLEVTNAQYRACVDDGFCQRPFYEATSYDAPKLRYSDPLYADFPIIGADKNQANRYCQTKGRRLPTEAEWERAARGAAGRDYAWGNDLPTCARLPEACAPASASIGWRVDRMRPVGTTPGDATPEGIMDMGGNARELVSDFYDADYYEASPELNPQGPSPPAGLTEADGSFRTARGAGFLYQPRDWPATSGAPAWARDQMASVEGFRCAHSAASASRAIIPKYQRVAWRRLQ